MSTRRVIDRFEAWAADGQPLVLATVVETIGSTYTKAGHRIVINSNGDYQGLVSGGCLEGDLAEHAQAVAAGQASRRVDYDMRDEADELFGSGVGCNGAMSILLQRLSPNDYEPFRSIAVAHRQPSGGRAATIITCEQRPEWVGATAVRHEDGDTMPDVSPAVQSALRTAVSGSEPASRSILDDGIEILGVAIRPMPRLLILGAGLDARPLMRIARELGWYVTVTDHRDDAVARAHGLADIAVHAPAAELHKHLTIDQFGAAVVMSHNLDADRHYLRQLAGTDTPFVGLLGPASRRERLIAELGLAETAFAGRVRGPVGLDLGADSPEAIALSIAAEVQLGLGERQRRDD